MLTILSTLAFAISAAALPTGDASHDISIPIHYQYGGYPRIQANITWGTPGSPSIPTIFDTGSVAYWVYGPNATINDGSNYLGTEGPCNKKVKTLFDWPKSSIHSKVVNLTTADVYSYGGNGKIVSAYQEINDTISFGRSSSTSPIKNVQVALSNFTVVRQLDDKCAIDVSTFDQSILGMAPLGVGGASASNVGPSFRSNLRSQGRIATNILSMWFAKAPSQVTGTYQGTALFGQPLPRSAYSGDLVSVKVSPPDGGYVGYYTGIPKLSVHGHSVSQSDASVTNCLVDSGTGMDELPFKMADVTKNSRVFEYKSPEGFVFAAWNGSCSSIPQNETLDFNFPGAKKGQSVTVKVPVRSYARGTDDGLGNLPKNICGLALTLDNYGGCTFGAPFFTAAALQFDDDKEEILMAQGGVA